MDKKDSDHGCAGGLDSIPLECLCPGKDVLSEEEERILGILRQIKAEYREISGAVRKQQQESKSDSMKKIEELRKRWNGHVEELKKANRTKWINLGYAPPD